jgi:hypothetical protein
MDQQTVFDKIELQELANKLFMFTDARDWNRLLTEVFTENVWFDMQSAGGGTPGTIKARKIADMWAKGFEGIDAIHHQAGHYLIDVRGNEASIFAYAIATHFKQKALKGKVRTFVGNYDLKAIRSAEGWRLSQFKYHLKYVDGNASLE